MKRLGGVFIVVLLAGLNCFGETPGTADSAKLIRMLQQSTLALLREGNLRFADGKPLHPNLEVGRRTELAATGQEPMAAVLACSDSREPVEMIFDRGVGDLFVIRVAGNVAGLSELATMEYGVVHLGTPLLIVMGHTKCGAVTAAVQGGELQGHLPSLISLIKPAVEKAGTSAPEDELIPRAIELNVWQQIENIFTRSALIRETAVAGKVQLIGAVYDLTSGKVQWLGQHPDLDRILTEAKSRSDVSETYVPATHPLVALTGGERARPERPANAGPEKHGDAHEPQAGKAIPTSVSPLPITRAEVANAHH